MRCWLLVLLSPVRCGALRCGVSVWGLGEDGGRAPRTGASRLGHAVAERFIELDLENRNPGVALAVRSPYADTRETTLRPAAPRVGAAGPRPADAHTPSRRGSSSEDPTRQRQLSPPDTCPPLTPRLRPSACRAVRLRGQGTVPHAHPCHK